MLISGPFTWQPITATSMFSLMSSNLDSNLFMVPITSKFIRAARTSYKINPRAYLQAPEDIPTHFTSSTGSEASEILSVSPIPSINKDPRPIADLTVPDRNPPASVIPRCKG